MLTLKGLQFRPIIAAALVLTLAGCSALRLAYSQADVLIYRWLDGYVDFTTEQAPQARDAVGRWLAWHRTTQLADYAALLDRAAGEVMQDTSPERVCRWFDDLRQRADTAVEQALPDGVALAARLEPRQLRRIAEKQLEATAELRDDFLQPDPRERVEASIERSIDRAEQLYGQLDAPQRDRIVQGVSASPFDADRWVAERERRQRDLLQTLEAVRAASGGHGNSATAPANGSSAAAANGLAPPNENGAALLRGWWQRVQRSPDDAYRRYAERLDPYNCDLAAQLHNLTTREQRETAQRRLRGWQSDLMRIAAPG